MPSLSIIFGYRNRDRDRVERCLSSLSKQSYNDFDVIFVDYGSNKNFAEEVKQVVETFPFAKYYYSNTNGYPWNRSHALNTGVRFSNSEYILFADIDLIYSPNSISALMENASKDHAVFSSMFFLNKSFKRWDKIFEQPLVSLNNSGNEPIGAIFLINKSLFESIGGFDEFYCFWGVEDRDLYDRLNQMNIKSIPIDNYKYPIFHQWHPKVTDRKRDFFPEKWWDEVNIYYSIEKNNIIRNHGNWGKLIKDKDRPVFDAQKANSIIISKYGKSYDKAQIIDSIVGAVKSLPHNQYLEIILQKRESYSFLNHVIKLSNLLSRKISFPLGLDYIENVEREKYYNPLNDFFYVIWYLIKRIELIKDYVFFDDDNIKVIRLMKNDEDSFADNISKLKIF